MIRVNRCIHCGAIKVRDPRDRAALICPTCPQVDPDELRELHVFHGTYRHRRDRLDAEWESDAYERERHL